MPNYTAEFLGDAASWEKAAIRLDDVQGLWGGRRLFVTGAGKAIVQTVARGMQELRYSLELAPGAFHRLMEICIAQDFLTCAGGVRPGRPDEPCPMITLVNIADEHRSVHKWAGDRNDRFGALYAALLDLETLAAAGEPVHSGAFDWNYAPAGFPAC
jgi:hypothetical protein